MKSYRGCLYFGLLLILFIAVSCQIRKNGLANQSKITSNTHVNLLDLDSSLTNFDLDCPCKVSFSQTVEISNPIKGEAVKYVREYYGSTLYAIGEKDNGVKTDLWITFCNNKKIAEELWFEGKIVWYRFFDDSGRQTEKVHYGIEAENY